MATEANTETTVPEPEIGSTSVAQSAPRPPARTRAMTHPHALKHRDTSSYLNSSNTTDTNRRNAGNLLRLISDDFNTRKFPELVAPFRPRSQSLPVTDNTGRRWRTATNAYLFLRRLSQSTFGGRLNEEGHQGNPPSNGKGHQDDPPSNEQ